MLAYLNNEIHWLWFTFPSDLMETWRENTMKALLVTYSKDIMVPTFCSKHLQESFGEQYGSCLSNFGTQKKVKIKQRCFVSSIFFICVNFWCCFFPIAFQTPFARHSVWLVQALRNTTQQRGSCPLCSIPCVGGYSTGSKIWYRHSVLAQSRITLVDYNQAITC